MLRKVLVVLLLVAIGSVAVLYMVLNVNPAPKTEIDEPAVVADQPVAEPSIGLAGILSPDTTPYEGMFFAFLVPVLLIGVPWIALQLVLIRYVQPRGTDLSTVRVKARDGLFVEASVSMTARRLLNLASTRMTWERVRSLVEKNIEQELIHAAIQFPHLESLEQNLKGVTEKFLQLPFIQELARDFGVEVIRFNIETRYPQETMDALNRKAEAVAGGAAYLAYAAAASLDPHTPECRELYKIYQETSGQVDAARNLGGGITSIAGLLSRKGGDDDEKE